MQEEIVQSDSSLTTESRGRIKIDLEEFFKDYRRQSYILLKSKWTTIKDLKEYVEETFGISDVVVLTSDEVYLPVTEAIDIVAADDELKIVTTTHVPAIPSPRELKQKSIIKWKTSDDIEIPLKPKRKRTHKRKLPIADKVEQTVAPKLPKKVLKTDKAPNVSHVFYDEDGNTIESKPVGVKFINYIDSLDATKPRVIKAKASMSCAKEVIETETTSKNENVILSATEMVAV